MKVVIYCRVSTDDKDQNPERQVLRCKQYCELHEHEIVGVYHEHISGSINPNARPKFIELLKDNPEGIIVFSIDRLSREHPSKIMLHLAEFKERGIIIISVTEPIFNMESSFAEPMQYFLTWWNNYFLKKLKEDVKSGIERARLQGKQIGRPKKSFNKQRAYQLLINENKSFTEVSNELNVSRATLCRFKKVAEKTPSLFIKESTVS